MEIEVPSNFFLIDLCLGFNSKPGIAGFNSKGTSVPTTSKSLAKRVATKGVESSQFLSLSTSSSNLMGLK